LLSYCGLQIREIQPLRAEDEDNPFGMAAGRGSSPSSELVGRSSRGHMVEPVDDDDCSDPVAVEAFTSLLYQDAELLSALMQRVVAKTKSKQTAIA
jgi:hypothetical protein